MVTDKELFDLFDADGAWHAKELALHPDDFREYVERALGRKPNCFYVPEGKDAETVAAEEIRVWDAGVNDGSTLAKALRGEFKFQLNGLPIVADPTVPVGEPVLR